MPILIPPPLPPPLRAPRPLSSKRAKVAGATHPRRPRLAPGVPKRVHKELSAGGVVVRQEQQDWLVALLKTEHKRGPVWVLPKGHVELKSGERVSEAARREVEEEAGLTDLSVKNQLGVTRFKFQVEDGMVYKTVHYFLMLTQQKTLHPQAEEGLVDAAWFPIDEAIKLLAYDTDQEIVRRAKERVTGVAARPRPRRPFTPRRARRSRIHT